MSWASEHKYKPKKKNIKKRTNVYSVPGTQEVVFKNEWEKKKRWWQFWK